MCNPEYCFLQRTHETDVHLSHHKPQTYTNCRLSSAVPNVTLSCTIGQICVVYGINMVTHTRKSCSAFTHPSTQTHSSEHTHTVNTHPEQWAAINAAVPREQLRVRCLDQGHLAVVLKVERALYIHSPHLQSLLDRDSNSQPFDYESDSLPLGHDFPKLLLTYWATDIVNETLLKEGVSQLVIFCMCCKKKEKKREHGI